MTRSMLEARWFASIPRTNDSGAFRMIGFLLCRRARTEPMICDRLPRHGMAGFTPRRHEMTDLSTHPTQIASAWLADFASALERRDVDAAVALFDPDCYWRDLVAFTW